MLRSYIMDSNRQGQVVLRTEILSQIGLEPDGVMYGAVVPKESALVLSRIPPESWSKAYKIIVHTHRVPGSLAQVADVLARQGLDTVSSWASCESSYGHLCSTTIVVPEDPSQFGDLNKAHIELTKQIGRSLSDLPGFSEGKLKPIRITPLSILATYGSNLHEIHADFHRVNLKGHYLDLGHSIAIGPETSGQSLWAGLQVVTQSGNVSSCIITPDTEEALLRVSTIPEASRLCELSFRLSIHSETGSFTGYWQHALKLIRDFGYSVYSAHNALVGKEDKPERKEHSEFFFLVDIGNSRHNAASFVNLREIWEDELEKSYSALAGGKAASAKVTNLRVCRARGTGVPCFFASNAKSTQKPGCNAAITLCQALQGAGFIPVSVDVSQMGSTVHEQVRELVKACEFMVVLHCPEEKLDLKNGEYGISNWVAFEEGVMSAKTDRIIVVRFANISEKGFPKGRMALEIPKDGIVDDQSLEDFKMRLAAWAPVMRSLSDSAADPPEILKRHMEHDLVGWYASRKV